MRGLIPALGLLLAALLVGPAPAAADRSVGKDQFVALAADVSTDDFRVAGAAVVRETLDRFVGTPGSRLWLRANLDHRQRFQGVVGDALAEAGLPAQLAAIPLVEAGYRNIGSDDPLDQLPYEVGNVGRGLWMFIRPTAQGYGLTVDDGLDERLDPERASAAAARLLTDLHRSFGSWPAALAAYNRGGGAVRRAMREHETRDIWTLIERGALPDYAARVMAGAIVLEHPELVDWTPGAPQGGS